MSDVAFASLFGFLGTTVVAAIGAVANLLGPGWRSARERAAAASDEQVSKRFRAAEAFLDALARWIPDALSGDNTHRSEAVAARQRLISALDPRAESNLGNFTTWLFLAVEQEPSERMRTLYINQGAEAIFASLHGRSSTLGPMPFTPDRRLLDPPSGEPLSGDLF